MKFALACIAVLLLAKLTIAFASDHVYPLDNGETLNFEASEGSWIVMAYWAVWCGPCRDEIRILNQIHEERDEHNVIVLGVNFDGVQDEELVEDKDFFGAQYPDLLQDPRERWGVNRAKVIPETIIINPQGQLHEVITGITTRKRILKAISQ